MNSRALGATRVFAWPGAEVAVMGARAAVGILHRRRLAAVPEADRAAFEERLVAEHEAIAGGVDRGITLGLVDAVIQPAETRYHLAVALNDAPVARGDHGNIPL